MPVDTPQGRKALVTGGSKGIGRATTELFLKLGAEAGFEKSPLEYVWVRLSKSIESFHFYFFSVVGLPLASKGLQRFHTAHACWQRHVC